MPSFLTDLELELLSAQHVAAALDLINDPRPTRDVDAVCISCGRKCHYVTRDRHAPALVRVRCNDCCHGDEPTPHRETAWGMKS